MRALAFLLLLPALALAQGPRPTPSGTVLTPSARTVTYRGAEWPAHQTDDPASDRARRGRAAGRRVAVALMLRAVDHLVVDLVAHVGAFVHIAHDR